jgi:hypothetical protein
MHPRSRSIVRRLLLGVVLLVSAGAVQAQVCSFPSNTGRVHRIYPQFAPASGPGTFFQLKGTNTKALNPNGYYFIPATPATLPIQSLYRSMHDLLVEAAKSGWTVQVRTANCGGPVAEAKVEYLVVDLP